MYENWKFAPPQRHGKHERNINITHVLYFRKIFFLSSFYLTLHCRCCRNKFSFSAKEISKILSFSCFSFFFVCCRWWSTSGWLKGMQALKNKIKTKKCLKKRKGKDFKSREKSYFMTATSHQVAHKFSSFCNALTVILR